MSQRAKEHEILMDAVDVAKAKFAVHRDKGSWEFKTVGLLIKELKREVIELENAKDKESVILERGDIVNYAAMILDIVRSKGVDNGTK